MALAAALGGDDAQDHAGGHTEQVGGHQAVGGQDHRVVQCQPHAGPVAQNVDHPAGGVQNVHAAQLHVGVVLHVGQLVGVTLAHLVHGGSGADACLDAEPHLVHHAFVVQHHALELQDGLLGGSGPLCHGVQLALGGAHRIFQLAQLPFRVKGPGAERFHMAFQPAHLPQHKARGRRNTFTDLHVRSPPAVPARSGPARPAPARMYWAAGLPAPPGPRPRCLQTAG